MQTKKHHNMKRTLFIVSLIALASCSNDEIVNVPPSSTDEIHLAVTTSKSLKSTSRAEHNAKLASDFKLWATKTDNPVDVYLDNETVKSNFDLASPKYDFSSGKRYWPSAGENLDFYAVHYGSAKELGLSDDPQFVMSSSGNYIKVDNVKAFSNYQLDNMDYSDWSKNEDFLCYNYVKDFYFSDFKATYPQDEYKPSDRTLWAKAKEYLKTINPNDYLQLAVDYYIISNAFPENKSFYEEDMLYAVTKGVNKDSNGGYAQLNFRHAMSKILFEASTNNKNIYVNIPKNGVQICGFENLASVSFCKEATSEQYDNTAGAYPYSSDCTWTMDATAAATAENEYIKYGMLHSFLLADKEYQLKAKEDSTVLNAAFTFKPDGSAILIPQMPKKGGKYGSNIYLKVRCFICFISDTDGLQDFLDKGGITSDYKTGYASSSLSQDQYIDRSINKLDAAILTGYDEFGPYGTLLFGNKKVTSYDDIVPDDLYQDIYIPLTFTDGDGNLLAWEPGKAYCYNLKFDFTKTDNGTPTYDGDGNEINNFVIKVNCQTIDNWEIEQSENQY